MLTSEARRAEHADKARSAVLTSAGFGRVNPSKTRYSIPASMARTAAWVRSDTPSLEIMCCTWILTVPRLTSRFWAIWGLV